VENEQNESSSLSLQTDNQIVKQNKKPKLDDSIDVNENT
jgi:hypothetical protein